MKKILFPILAFILAVGLAVPMAMPVAAATTTDSYYSGNSDFDTETVAVSTSFVNYGLGGVTYGTAGSVVNLVPHVAWAIVKTTYPQLTTANWVSSADPIEDPVGDSWRQFASTFEIPTGATSLSAVLEITADNSYEVSLNGTLIGSEGDVYGYATNYTTNYWSAIESWSGATIDGALQTGTNTLTVVARNWAQTGGTTGSNPTGLIYKLAVTYEEFVAEPGITVEKEATEVNGEPIGDPKEALENDTITYEYTVTNTGNVPLLDVSLVDDMGTVDTGDDVTIALSPLTDEDADTSLDDLAVSASATGTRDYTVPWFTAGPVENEATASGWYDSTEYTDDDDESVDILHHPDIEVTKEGPPETDEGKDGDGYFQTVEADYEYTVTNTGDCGLHVTLVDDQIGTIATFDLTPEDDPWTGDASNLLECECETITCFTNKATATGTDATDQTVEDTACWTVLVFQWQPRTIGYWGNWQNHYSETEILALLGAVEVQSDNIEGQDLHVDVSEDIDDIHDFLLGKNATPKGKMNDAKALKIMEKQLLATWFNVKSYEDWVGTYNIPGFPGSPDAAMDPDATVFLTEEDEVGLFGSTPTVMEILEAIEAGKDDDWGKEQFQIAYAVLDKLNNAEDNGYGKFIPPWFHADACPLMLENKDSTWQIEVDDTYGKLFYNASGNTFDFVFCAAGLEDGEDYSLIYYADYEDRYVEWGGDNPGALIAEMTTDGHGSVCVAGSIDLGMDLPDEDDYNYDTHDYSGPPDNYSNAHGAKIWLVPSDCLTVSTDLPVVVWAPTRFLFETDLIWYDYIPSP